MRRNRPPTDLITGKIKGRIFARADPRDQPTQACVLIYFPVDSSWGVLEFVCEIHGLHTIRLGMVVTENVATRGFLHSRPRRGYIYWAFAIDRSRLFRSSVVEKPEALRRARRARSGPTECQMQADERCRQVRALGRQELLAPRSRSRSLRSLCWLRSR